MQNEFRVQLQNMQAQITSLSARIASLEAAVSSLKPVQNTVVVNHTGPMVEYKPDTEPLTDEQIDAIREASPATDIPQESFTRGLFGAKPVGGAYL